jgi:hypothetical protein
MYGFNCGQIHFFDVIHSRIGNIHYGILWWKNGLVMGITGF